MNTQITYSLTYMHSGRVLNLRDSRLTMKASVVRNATEMINTASIQIYNLNRDSRRFIFKDRWSHETERPYIILQAGFNDKNYTVFQGTVLEGYSKKESGSPDIITYITCQDGLANIRNAEVNITFSEGKTSRDIIQETIKYMGLPVDNIGNLDNSTINRAITVSGNAYQQLQELTNDSVFIDNGKVNILQENEIINEIVELNSDSHIIGTPTRYGRYVHLPTLFIPQIRPGQGMEIKSGIETAYDGLYKVVGFRHNIIASGAVVENSSSEFELFVPIGHQFIYV